MSISKLYYISNNNKIWLLFEVMYDNLNVITVLSASGRILQFNYYSAIVFVGTPAQINNHLLSAARSLLSYPPGAVKRIQTSVSFRNSENMLIHWLRYETVLLYVVIPCTHTSIDLMKPYRSDVNCVILSQNFYIKRFSAFTVMRQQQN